MPEIKDKYERLKAEAREACKFRGHTMHHIRRVSGDFESGDRRGAAKCRNCPAYVQIIERPSANEISIGGPAVAMTCPTDPKWC